MITSQTAGPHLARSSGNGTNTISWLSTQRWRAAVGLLLFKVFLQEGAGGHGQPLGPAKILVIPLRRRHVLDLAPAVRQPLC
jgi:hypothetical protein